MSLLEVHHISKTFGGVLVLENLDLGIERNTIVGLIGPNGAGKTTLINILTGILKPNSGEIFFRGKNITGLKPHKLARIGIARTFQTTRLFNERTVLENILMTQLPAVIPDPQRPFFNNLIGRKINSDKAEELLHFVGLSSYRDSLAKNIPFAQQRFLAIGLALAIKPEILTLDEPVAGMNPSEVQEMIYLIQRIWNQGMTILLVEHNMRMVMSCCQSIVVLNYGKKIAEGTPEEITKSEIVIQAYLGEKNGS